MGYEASAEEIFLAALPFAERPRKGARALADAEGGTGHGGECNLTSAFQQEIVAAVIRLQPPQSKGGARERVSPAFCRIKLETPSADCGGRKRRAV
jgi:hypothetical protein